MKFCYIPPDGLGEGEPEIQIFEAGSKPMACRHVEDQRWELGGQLFLQVEWSEKPCVSDEVIAKNGSARNLSVPRHARHEK